MKQNRHSNSTVHYRTFNRFTWLLALALAMLGATFGLYAAEQTELVVYKSPTCGCCKGWVKHMRENNYKVEVHNQQSVQPVKDAMGVPAKLRSCHTAVVEGYVIEGHVPADAVARLLRERPPIRGLAVPGMVMGTPGMEGPRNDPYDIIAFEDDGSVSIYEQRR